MQEEPLLKEDLISTIWQAYRKTPEYKSGKNKAIPKDNKLILNAESNGLERIYINFIDNLKEGKFRKEEIKLRKPSNWLEEWRKIHDMLFQYVLANRGVWRKIDVRFRDVGDEKLHKIPHAFEVPNQMNFLAEYVANFSRKDFSNKPDKLFSELAKIHYGIIRIHPFKDGNGRIARAIVDQLALLNGFPPAMGGYPRLSRDRRTAYHKSITECIEDKECKSLAGWIRSYFDIQMRNLA